MSADAWRVCYGTRSTVGLLIFTACFWIGLSTVLPRAHPEDPANPALGAPSGLPLPSKVSEVQFEESLYNFLNTRKYVQLGWLPDKGVRDTGPYIKGKYYGTHPAVRVYYSPGVIRWLKAGRAGKVPDGEMIIKEQFAAPALRHQGKTDKELWSALESWTVMVKDSIGSQDGWYWSNPAKGQCVVNRHQPPFDYPVSGFGLYCIRCHASTQSLGAETTSAANEFTFASLRNITGFPGKPIQFQVDDSWRKELHNGKPETPASENSDDAHPRCTRPKKPDSPVREADKGFLDFFSSIRSANLAEVVPLPPVTHDWVVSSRDPSQEFITSNQCMSCHAGLLATSGISMFVPAGKNTEYGAPGWDVSPYGEWRWTPMGLAGRDPVFFAQLESEIHLIGDKLRSNPALAAKIQATLVDTCLRCHGAMGKRQFDLDHPGGEAKFTLAHVHTVAGSDGPFGQGTEKYGALAREGVGCMVCHRMQPPIQPPEDHRPYLQYFLESSITGNFHLGKNREIYGPFKDEDLAPYAMEHATGWKPGHSAFLKSSRLCGTCHTVALPAVAKPLPPGPSVASEDDLARCEIVPLFQGFHHHVEQATYLEWLNSGYENEIHKENPQAQSCQDCHMSRGLKDKSRGIDIPQIQTRIAGIQDTTYPEAENLAPRDHLDIRSRAEGFRRHNFAGLNFFLIELFHQFDDILGVPKTDFMTGSQQEVAQAADNVMGTARNDVASLAVDADMQGRNRLTARVVVTNKAGHRFPSGVSFRRAFLELLVVQKEKNQPGSDRIVWSSGRTNELGVLIGADGRPLPTEFFTRDPVSGQQQYQKHHVVITSPDQVQVYETLRRNVEGEFTTSFVLGCETVKDNRLLPRGWKRAGPGPDLAGSFLQATQPDPETARDPRYADGSGTDEITYHIDLPGDIDPARLQVRATLFYQATPPYFLRNLFETAPDGPETRRLHYLCSHVNLKGTPLENWKLPITSTACDVQMKSGPEAKPGQATAR